VALSRDEGSDRLRGGVRGRPRRVATAATSTTAAWSCRPLGGLRVPLRRCRLLRDRRLDTRLGRLLDGRQDGLDDRLDDGLDRLRDGLGDFLNGFGDRLGDFLNGFGDRLGDFLNGFRDRGDDLGQREDGCL
jgi:hypothetical protein